MDLISLIERYGTLVVGLGTFFEGETVMVLGGLAAHRGYLSLPSVILAGFLGSLAGDQLWFQIGRRRGERFLERRPDWRKRSQRVQERIERHHVAFILGFRFLYGLRTIAPFALGMTAVPTRRFLLLNTLGAALWALAVGLLGYSLGEAAEALLGRAERAEALLFAGIAALGVLVWALRAWRRRTRAGRS